ncbi:MAG: cytochrome d ubiquinol oxidase subunit II [Anaerolineae bacterium]|nr:cytochrome d ubiquinol oxidase subunit II [Anaerolineae bacterium]
MDLNTLWFILITVLFTGFFFLEGFDYGVGILLPFLGKDDTDRRVIINTIGPFWDGNEVWLITAGGAMFAAFPNWYATLFSGFYVALVLMLLALIVRGVAFEFRSADKHPTWRAVWDWAIFFGSLIPALLWGVALANLLIGVPIGETMAFEGNFWSLISPISLLGGLAGLVGFVLHGAMFLVLKTEGEVQNRARKLASWFWMVVGTLVMAVFLVGFFGLSPDSRPGLWPVVIPLVEVLLMLAGLMSGQKRDGLAFIMSGLAIVFSNVMFFVALFPSVMISSLNDDWSLTIYNAASSPYTLRTMSWVALIFVPIVLAYQGWTYWVFRKRIGRESELKY